MIEKIILRQCYAHGIDTYPEEACGLISGPADQQELLSKVHRMRNVLDEFHAEIPVQFPRTNLTGYIIDPMEHRDLENQLKTQNQSIKIIYHNHVDKHAYFSETDIKYALWHGEPTQPGVHYLVCSIRNMMPAGAVLAMFNSVSEVFDVVKIE